MWAPKAWPPESVTHLRDARDLAVPPVLDPHHIAPQRLPQLLLRRRRRQAVVRHLGRMGCMGCMGHGRMGRMGHNGCMGAVVKC